MTAGLGGLRGLVGAAGLGGAASFLLYNNLGTSEGISFPSFPKLAAKTEDSFTKPQTNKFKSWDFNWDQRQPNENDDTKKPTATRNIILIRHGQYNLDGKTDSERYLTSLGVEQAKLTGLRLAELSLPFTHIAQSRMCRAMQTAKIVSETLPGVPVLKEDGLLNEGAPIQPQPVNRWKPEHYFEVDGARIEAAFRKYFHRADVEQEKETFEIIVCHANVIRYFFCRALQLPPEAWLRISLKNASYSWLVIRPDGKVHCRGLGEAGHFPPEMRTTT